MIPKMRVWDELGGRMVYNVGLTPEGIAYTIPKHAEESDQFDYYPECPIMQDTGLKDNNGKNIYVGDVLGDYIEEPLHVEYSKEHGGFVFVDEFGKYGTTKYSAKDIAYDSLEVIGNIYENPITLTR